MIQMDAKTRKLGKETRDMGNSLHNNSALLYNVSSRSFFSFFYFCERLITLIFELKHYQKTFSCSVMFPNITY